MWNLLSRRAKIIVLIFVGAVISWVCINLTVAVIALRSVLGG